MMISTEAKRLIAMEIKARAFNSINNIVDDRDYTSVQDAMSDIIDILDDALEEIKELENGFIGVDK